MERWLPIPGYVGLYQVSNQGNVRRVGAALPLKQQATKQGRMRVSLCKGGTPQWHQVHRLVLLAFKGPPPPGLPYGLHRDDNHLNNTPGNLVWGTQAQNMAQAAARGRLPRGTAKHNAKLTPTKVAAMRAAWAAGASTTALAAAYGISQPLASNVVRRKAWKHVA